MARLAIARGFLAEYAKLQKDVQSAVDAACTSGLAPGQPITVPLGWPAPHWVTLRREDGTYERFHTGGGLTLPPQPMGGRLHPADRDGSAQPSADRPR